MQIVVGADAGEDDGFTHSCLHYSVISSGALALKPR